MHENMYNGNDGDGGGDDDDDDDGSSNDGHIDNNNQIQFEMNYGSALNTPKHTQRNVKSNPKREGKK